MRGLATAQRTDGLERLTALEVPVAHGLLDREHLLRKLDRAVTRRVTVISAPAGSGKTSLLRAWADRSSNAARVAFVSVDRDEHEAQRFWSRVLGAIRGAAASTDRQTQPAAAGVPGDELVDAVVSELGERAGPFVLIIDDLHELRSADAVAQLQRLLAVLPRLTRRFSWRTGGWRKRLLSSRWPSPTSKAPNQRAASASRLPSPRCGWR